MIGSSPITLNTQPQLIDLTEGIYEVPLEHVAILKKANIQHTFLDRLILPGPLASLSPAQIIAINRFRERERGSDAQFRKAEDARRTMLSTLRHVSAENLVEVGMGKYPLQMDLDLTSYFGLDIDPEAIKYCQDQGIDAGTYQPLPAIYDCAAAVFSMHFAITASQLTLLSEALTHDGLLIAVVIDDESGGFADMMAKLSPFFTASQVVLHPAHRRERWVVCSKDSGAPRRSAAYAHLNQQLAAALSATD